MTKDQLTDLDFANDTALLAESHPTLQEMTTKNGKGSGKDWVENQWSKNEESVPVKVEQEPVEEVMSFTYLGSIVTSNSDAETDVRCRIGKAAAVFRRLTTLWCSNNISIELKIPLYKTARLPIETYAAETWKNPKNHFATRRGKKECTIIDVAISADMNVAIKEQLFGGFRLLLLVVMNSVSFVTVASTVDVFVAAFMAANFTITVADVVMVSAVVEVCLLPSFAVDRKP
uniref:Uncharacterized protein n=1 Tax=Octopus bimaculoides TaxID=37653 RepID=A0A0L8GF25_OCTBM